MARRVGHNTIAETVRKVLLTYWNTVAFQSLYARASGWEPGAVVTVGEQEARLAVMPTGS